MFTVVAWGSEAPLGHIEEYFGALQGALSQKSILESVLALDVPVILFFYCNSNTKYIFGYKDEYTQNHICHPSPSVISVSNSKSERMSKTKN